MTALEMKIEEIQGNQTSDAVSDTKTYSNLRARQDFKRPET